MRIECPHCHAVFEVPEAMAKGVKRLRCANCGDSWEMTAPVVTAQESVPEATPAVFEVPEEESSSKPDVVDAPSPVSEGTFRATGGWRDETLSAVRLSCIPVQLATFRHGLNRLVRR